MRFCNRGSVEKCVGVWERCKKMLGEVWESVLGCGGEVWKTVGRGLGKCG